MPYKVGDIEPIHGDNYRIVTVEPFGKYEFYVMAKIIKKDGTNGKRTATFFSDQRVRSLKIRNNEKANNSIQHTTQGLN